MSERIYYDGDCGLCHRAVKFVLRHERGEAVFRFAPLIGETFEREVPAEFRQSVPDSIVVQLGDGRLLVKFRGARHILLGVGGPWRLLGQVLWIVPPFLGDLFYDFIARIRHYLFARPGGTCPLVPPAQQKRFDP